MSKAKTKVRVKTHITKTVTLEITAEDIINVFNLPDDTEVKVYVPDGGDWSNMDLHIDEDCPIEAIYMKEYEEEQENE